MPRDTATHVAAQGAPLNQPDDHLRGVRCRAPAMNAGEQRPGAGEGAAASEETAARVRAFEALAQALETTEPEAFETRTGDVGAEAAEVDEETAAVAEETDRQDRGVNSVGTVPEPARQPEAAATLDLDAAAVREILPAAPEFFLPTDLHGLVPAPQPTDETVAPERTFLLKEGGAPDDAISPDEAGGGLVDGPLCADEPGPTDEPVPLEQAVATVASIEWYADEDHVAAAAEAAVDEAPQSGEAAGDAKLAAQPVSRLRRVAALVLAVAAALAVVVAAASLWARAVLTDGERFAAGAVAIDDADLRAAVSRFVTDEVITVSKLRTRIEDALPGDSKALVPAFTRSLRLYLNDEIDAFLRTPTAGRLWRDAAGAAHAQLVNATGAEDDGDQARLDLLPLVAVALQRLQDSVPRVLGRDVTLPSIDPVTPPDHMRILLQDALGQRVPEELGVITVADSAKRDAVARVARWSGRLAVVSTIVAVILIVAAALLASRRRRCALWFGLTLLVTSILVIAFDGRLGSPIPGPDAATTVARELFHTAISNLDAVLSGVAVAGALIALLAVGDAPRAVLARSRARSDQSRQSPEGLPGGSTSQR